MSPGIVIADNGRLPWLSNMATTAQRAGLLARYVTAVAARPDRADRVERIPPRALTARIAREMRRRAVPEDVPQEKVATTAAMTQFLWAGIIRAGLSEELVARGMVAHGALFDRGLARLLEPDDEIVITSIAAALRTIERARALGVRSIVDFPVAHHDFVARTLTEEARLVPEYAGTLQSFIYSDKVTRRLDRELAAADHVIVLSSFHERTFAEAGVDPDKFVRLTLGADTDLFRPPSEPADDGVFRVVFTGQITQRKGISYLVDAFERAAIPNSELLFVGRAVGTAEPWAGRPGIRHVPQVPRWELPAILGGSDVYVLPSLLEGFPLSAIEAMACGVPSIVSEHTFAHDVITEGVDGFVVPVRDPDALAERFRFLHDNPDRRREIGRAGHERAQNFSWARHSERFLHAVGELLGTADSSGRGAPHVRG